MDEGRRLAFGMELPAAIAELKAALRRGNGVAATVAAGSGQAAARVLPPTTGLARTGPNGAKFLKP